MPSFKLLIIDCDITRQSLMIDQYFPISTKFYKKDKKPRTLKLVI